MVEEIKLCSNKIKISQNIVVLTGAGISAESGIPTFRGENGLWKNYRAEDLATPSAFMRNPQLVWEWYCWRRRIIKKAGPNAGHIALKEMEEILRERFFLITQNVDGLHRKAGNENVIEFHGNIWVTVCSQCGKTRWDETENYSEVPRCEACGGFERPGVVWFGEPIPERVLQASFEKARNCDVFMVIGTSGIVQPAASLASIAKSAGAFIVEINIERTPLSPLVDLNLKGRAGEILPAIVENLKE